MDKSISGFIVSNGAESFKRSLTGTTRQIAFTNTRLPFDLDKICIAQQPLGFDAAYNYAKIAAKENDFNFIIVKDNKSIPSNTMMKFLKSQFTKFSIKIN